MAALIFSYMFSAGQRFPVHSRTLEVITGRINNMYSIYITI